MIKKENQKNEALGKKRFIGIKKKKRERELKYSISVSYKQKNNEDPNIKRHIALGQTTILSFWSLALYSVHYIALATLSMIS